MLFHMRDLLQLRARPCQRPSAAGSLNSGNSGAIFVVPSHPGPARLGDVPPARSADLNIETVSRRLESACLDHPYFIDPENAFGSETSPDSFRYFSNPARSGVLAASADLTVWRR